jgi:hypothetical protein
MAERPVVENLGNLTNETTAVQNINNNINKLADAVKGLLSTTDLTENTMNISLDMNGQRIINLPTPVLPTDPIRLGDRDLVKGDTGEPGPQGPKGELALSSLVYTGISQFEIPSNITSFITSGYATPGDLGGTRMVLGTSNGIKAVADLSGRYWVIDTPDLVPAEAFGAGFTGNDGPVFEYILNNVGVLNLRERQYFCSTTINSGALPVTIRGVDVEKSQIVMTAAGPLILHGFQVGGPVYNAPFKITNVRIARSGGTRNTTTKKIPGTAISIKQNPATGVVEMSNVRFDSFSAATAWEKHVFVTGSRLGKYRNCIFDGPAFETDPTVLDGGTDINVHLYSGGNDNLMYQTVFEHCDFKAVTNGLLMEIDGPEGNTGSIEGVVIIDCGGRTVRGPWIRQRINKLASSGRPQDWCPPGFWMERCNFQGTFSCLDLDSMSEIHIVNNFHYLEDQLTHTGNEFIPNMVRIGRTKNCTIDGNLWSLFAGPKFGNPNAVGAKVDNFLKIGDYGPDSSHYSLSPSSNVLIINNAFSVESPSSCNMGINLALDMISKNVEHNLFDGGGIGNAAWPYGDARKTFGCPTRIFAEGNTHRLWKQEGILVI